MFVVTVDQSRSRSTKDRVGELVDALSGTSTVSAFERSVGDEVQGVLEDPRALAEVILIVIREGGWHLGIGHGQIDGIPVSARAGSGPAFINAREAVTRAKKSDPSIALVGGETGLAVELEMMARLIASVEDRRSPAQRDVVDRLEAGKTGAEIAAELGISAQAVSQRRIAARYDVTVGAVDVLTAMARRWQENS